MRLACVCSFEEGSSNARASDRARRKGISAMDALLDRRKFIVGAVAGGFAAATLGSCSPKTEDGAESAQADQASDGLNAESARQSRWAFEVPPEPVDEGSVTNTYEADIVVVGAGVSGLVCAASAAEEGADVILFAASATPVSRGGSNHGINTKAQERLGIDYTPENVKYLMKKELAYNSVRPDASKWWRWINNSKTSMDWLIDLMEGAGYTTTIEVGYRDVDGAYTELPGAHGWVGDDVTEGAHLGETLVTSVLEKDILDHGGTIHYKTVALYLEKDGERVSGVIAKNEQGDCVRYRARNAVVLATGDFSGDADMMQRYCPEYASLLIGNEINYDATFQTGGMFPGDGHKMGLWVGAAWQKTYPNAAMINCNSANPHSQSMSTHEGINLNMRGERFMNEDTICSFAAYQYLLQPEGTWYTVWDDAYAEFYPYWEGVGCTYGSEDGRLSADEERAAWESSVEAGAFVKGDTVEDVLRQLDGIDVETALKTIERYNGYAENGLDEEYHKNKAHLAPIKTGPFYGCKSVMQGGMNFLCVMGGLRTSKYMEVCDENDVPIPGLYNIGVMVGDAFAGIYSFSVPGHNLGMNCVTFGYLLGKQLATGEVVG